MLLTQSKLLSRVRNKPYLASFSHAMNHIEIISGYQTTLFYVRGQEECLDSAIERREKPEGSWTMSPLAL